MICEAAERFALGGGRDARGPSGGRDARGPSKGETPAVSVRARLTEMKVVRIIARLNVGGPARHVVWLTAGLRGSDCQTELVAGRVPAGEADMGYFANQNGVAPIYIEEMSREISFQDLISIAKIYRLLMRERPDIIHTHTAKAGTVGRLAALLYRCSAALTLRSSSRPIKVVHTYHGHIFHGYYGPLKTRFFLLIERVLARIATDRIVVVSKQQLKEINQSFSVGRKQQFVVIPLGLDLSQFSGWQDRRQPFREQLGAGPQEILVGIVGRLTGIKNHQLFFDVAKLVLRGAEGGETPPVRFVVIGEGDLRQALENQVTRDGLGETTVFTGTRSDPENFYPALDVVALTSRNEGTPLTLIEAMANSRPVIATAVGGVIDLLGEPVTQVEDGFEICERGIRVPPGNAQAFAAGILRLMADAELRDRLGEAGKKFVEQNYTKQRLLEDMSGLYKELMNELKCDDARAARATMESKTTQA